MSSERAHTQVWEQSGRGKYERWMEGGGRRRYSEAFGLDRREWGGVMNPVFVRGAVSPSDFVSSARG